MQFLSRKKGGGASNFARREDIRFNCSTALSSLSRRPAGLICDHAPLRKRLEERSG